MASTFAIIDGNVVNTLSIEHVEPMLCGFSDDDSGPDKGDVIGSYVITHNSDFETREHTPEEIHDRFLS